MLPVALALAAVICCAAPSTVSAQITNTQVVDIRIGSTTGANTKFNTNALIYNFGITTSGGFDYLMTNMLFQLDRGTGVSQDVFIQVFNGFGGTGSLILTNRLNYTNVGTAFAPVNLLLGTNLLVGPGSYSVRLTSGATGSGADTYQFKLGALTLTDTNGTQLPVLQWVEDTDPNGTATTNLVTTNPILADFMISTNNVNFGNYRVGSALTTNVTLTNNGFATTNNFTGSLLATATNSNAATVSGVTTNFIQQGQTDPFTVGLVTTNVGTNSGTVTLSYQSATNGTAISNRATWPTNIGSQSIAVTGVGYRLATDAVSTTNVNLGNFRIVDGVGTTNVAITNTATADGFSEGLGVSNSATTGAATIANLPGGLVAAGGTTNVTVGLSTANAGTNNGTVTLGFNSSGVGTSGFAATNIGTTNINVVAVGYRLASDALSTTNVNLGNFRIVNGAGTTNVAISNNATADGFSEGLGVANNGTTGSATVTNIPGSLIAAGGNSAVTVGLSTANAGTNSGTITFGFNSDGAGTSGFGATNIGSQAVNVVGVGYRLANESVSTTNLNLGRFHVGYNTNMGSLSGTVGITNTATGDGFSEGLAVADNGTTGGATVGGLPGGLVVAGSNTSISVGLGSISSVGNGNTGSVTLGFQSSGVGTSGFAATNIGTQVVNVSALGYSGQAYWNQDSGGSWNNFDNWDIPGGTPGIDGALLSTNDQATFGSMISASRTVNLDGQNPVLTLLAFSNSSASYTVAQGSGGSITMGTATNQTPVISNAAGSHAVSAGITLAYDTQANIAANSKLALSGALGGTKNFEKTGAGTLVIGGTGNLSGDTTVNAGTLEVNGSISSSDVTVNSGAVLSGSGSVGGIVLNLGGTVSPGNSPGTIYSTNVVWNPGGNYLWQIHNAAGTAGSTNGWDLVSVTNGGTLELGSLDEFNRFNIDLWSLSGINPDTNGPALNFDNTQSYRWTILTAEGGINGFATNKFNLYLFATNGSAGWANNLGSGFITIDVQGNNLDLVFNPNTGPSPVPEPGTWAAAALLLGAAGYVRWRKRSQAAA